MGTIYRIIYVRRKRRGSVYEIKRRLADRLYTTIIKLQRGNICEKCKTQHPPNSKGLHISHYFSRVREPVRFDPENTDLLCMACHLFFSHHRAEYTKFKRKQLGIDAYNNLFVRAKLPFNKATIKAQDKLRVKQFKEKIYAIRKSIF